ncbi:MAG TPA: hypothetical protein VF729_07440 [Solirubrobacterales bacterium]
MRRLGLTLLATALLGLSAVTPAAAEFGLSDLDVAFRDKDGNAEIEAGSHPFAATTSFRVNTTLSPEKNVQVVDGALRNLDVLFPEGFVANRTATPRCQTLDFLSDDGLGHPNCADSTAIGILLAEVGGGTGIPGKEVVAVHSMQPSPGTVMKLGFWVGGVPTTIDVSVNPAYPHNGIASLSNASQIVEVLSSVVTVWGNPADPTHDTDRGACAYDSSPPDAECETNVPQEPFLTLPRSCTGPLLTNFHALSWWSGNPLQPGPPATFAQTVPSEGLQECEGLRFSPTLTTQPSTERAASASGLDVRLTIDDPGLRDPNGRAHSDMKKAVVTLPEGMTINPSQAEGLATCSEADLARESASSPFGAGCPAASKIGTVEVESPLLEGEVLTGSLFVAEPYTNRFGSLLAVYQVIKSPELGVVVKLAGEVEPDPRTGQIVTTFGGEGTDPLPQLPFSEFRLRFREGGRSPLITPSRCGTHETKAVFTPWANPSYSFLTTSTFELSKGVGGGPCPAGGPPPFEPGFSAGTLNNSAGAHSAFAMRLTRRDGDADLTRFDAVLPPGLVAKLTGVARCPDQLIAQIRSKTGRSELADPSCPASSQIGTLKAGAGVGSQLTYVPGRVYLAGPVGKAPLSVVAVVPAVAGPFDVGVVVTRQALALDPVSTEVEVDGALSDPIPHILAGIPLAVRDVQVSVDRPSFTLNPTNCAEMSIDASIWGGGFDPFSLADDSPVPRAERFQAADCARLGFKPRLSLRLRGGTKRGGHPALTTVYRPRPGDANLARAVVRLPRSAFLDQAHIRTICTRVQFAADACPKGAIYGQVTARTPLLEEPLEGPAYLRSSDNELPDLVFDLHGLVDVEVSVRIDAVKGGIRATVEDAPDAPLSKALISMQGGRKGLIVNSRNLCDGISRAKVNLKAQSAKRRSLRPAVRPRGCKKRRPG